MPWFGALHAIACAAYLIAAIWHAYVCLQWEPSPELLDPKDENLIDVDTSYLVRPGQFEPGFGQAPHAHNPLATAPPPTDSVLFADFPGVHSLPRLGRTLPASLHPRQPLHISSEV